MSVSLARALPVRPSRVVLLGASGFLGRFLAERWRHAGVPVLPLASADIDLTGAEAPAQLRDRLREGDVIVMLSAITREKGRDPATYLRNAAMGAHVAASITDRLAHVVYVSSDAVYGDVPALPITEQTPCNPSCLYGAVHVARELMLADACAAGGVPYVILRPTVLYGPGDTHGSYGPNRFFRTATHGTITLFGEGEELRDFVFVEDAARLIDRVVRKRATGVLNVATGRAVSFATVASLVAAAVPTAVRITTEPRAVPVVHREFDVSETARAFPDFRYTSLEDGIVRTAAALLTAQVPVTPRSTR